MGEAGPTVTITAQRVGGSSGAVGVSYATANGTATGGQRLHRGLRDAQLGGRGHGEQDLHGADRERCAGRTQRDFTVTLSAPTGGATLGSPSSGTVTITDNDPTPTVQFSQAASSGAESTTPAVINVILSAASGRTVTVKYATANGTATAGSDYTARRGR